MTLSLGKSIKDLRIKKDITQEKFAEYLGVTPQAVSRWEKGSGYPDIELLPGISTFFGVSLDELMGIDLSAAEQDKIVMHISELIKNGEFESAISEGREALKKFPSNYTNLFLIGAAINGRACPRDCNLPEEKRKALLEEGVSLLKKVIDDCPDQQSVMGAKVMIGTMLKRLERDDEAIEYIGTLPLLTYAVEYALPNYIDGDDLKKVVTIKLPFIVSMFSSFLLRAEYTEKDTSPTFCEYDYKTCLRFLGIWDNAFDVSHNEISQVKTCCFQYMFLHFIAAKRVTESGDSKTAIYHLEKVLDCCEQIAQFKETLYETNNNNVLKTLLPSDKNADLDMPYVLSHNVPAVLLKGYFHNHYFATLEGNPEYKNIVKALESIAE